MNKNIAASVSIYIYVLALALFAIEVRAQDPHFSQFYANPIYTNPAFAGGSYVGRIGLNYRSQWPSISGTFRTFSASYDEHFNKLNGGIGLLATNDEAGVGTLRSTSASFIYSYQIILSKYVTMRAGIQVGFTQKTIDFSKLQFFDQIIRTQGFVRATSEKPIEGPKIYPNINVGTVIYSNKFYAGFAIHNLNEPEQGFYGTAASKIPMRYTAHGGLIIPIRKNRDPKKESNFYPNVLYMQQLGTHQINLGMYVSQGPVVFGTYFRQSVNTSDAFILLLGIRTQKVKIGFSYDVVTSKVYSGAAQSYEVSLGFELKKRTPKSKVRNIRCPEF
jgi:type IX secretion system PorP/SprF family membrane protein